MSLSAKSQKDQYSAWKDTLAAAAKEPTMPDTPTQPPIPLPADLKPGDIIVTNRGERVITAPDIGWEYWWRPDGRDIAAPETDWIVAIERAQATTPATVDMVNHPPHYTAGGIECIDAIRAALGDEGFIAFCRGQVMRYVWRTGRKWSDAEDMEKAAWYANRAAAAIKETKK